MKEIVIQQLKHKLDKDKDYSKEEIKKVINNILQQNEMELSLYIKIASREKRDIDTIVKDFYEKKILLNK